MSKRHLPVIAELQNPTTLGGLHIVESREPADGCIAAIAAGVGHVRITRAQLVSLRDQIDQWLEIHEE